MSAVRYRIGMRLAILAAAVGASGGVFAASAAALPPGCVQAGATVLCPHTSTGSEQQFVVPPGVSSIGVTAVGGKGGAGATSFFGGAGGAGAFGAVVTGQLAVTPGQVLYLEVGGNGQAPPNLDFAGAGGFNGGGGGAAIGASSASGGGGGASDLRTCPRASVSCTLGTASDPRLLVAAGGGGGGAGFSVAGGAGGAAGPVPAPGAKGANTADAGGGGGAGGTGGSLAAGGTGGAAGTPFLAGVPASPGTDGSVGQGGAGAVNQDSQAPGGGGGGGWYGGGGGGSGAFSGSGTIGGGGGGGAGGSFASPGATVAQDSTGTPSITISYVAPSQAAQVSPAALTFGTQPQSTIGAQKAVTFTNIGGAQLLLTGLTFSGSNPQDYLVTSNACLGPLGPGASCTVGVSFAPQAQGPSTASLQIASTDPKGPASVSLSGAGGALPERAARSDGAARAAGPGGQDRTGRLPHRHENGDARRAQAQGHATDVLDSARVRAGQVHDKRQRRERECLASGCDVRDRPRRVTRQRPLAARADAPRQTTPSRTLHPDADHAPRAPAPRAPDNDHHHLASSTRALHRLQRRRPNLREPSGSATRGIG